MAIDPSDLNRPGYSARHEYNVRLSRYAALRDARRHARRPIVVAAGVVGLVLLIAQPPAGLMLLIVALALNIDPFSPPHEVVSWGIGADGEAQTARYLKPLQTCGYFVLNDRSVPGRKDNIDHIVVGPTGIFVIESKSYTGRLWRRGGELFINRRKCTFIVNQAIAEARAVERALAVELGPVDVEVMPILCVHRAKMPWRPLVVDGVPIFSGSQVARWIAGGQTVLTPAGAERLAWRLDMRLPAGAERLP